jgi:hypothetical protein
MVPGNVHEPDRCLTLTEQSMDPVGPPPLVMNSESLAIGELCSFILSDLRSTAPGGTATTLQGLHALWLSLNVRILLAANLALQRHLLPHY